MRAWLLGAATALLFLAAASASQADQIRVEVNGEPVSFTGIGPQEVQGRVLVPLRGVLEKLGAFVDWVPSTQTVMASRGNLDMQLRIGSRTAQVNGRDVALDVPATTMGGSTMVPLRFVGETLGADVRWVAQSSTVVITTQPASPEDDRSGVRGAGYERRYGRRDDRNRNSDRATDRDRYGDRFSGRDRNGDRLTDRDRTGSGDLPRDRSREADRQPDRQPDQPLATNPTPAPRPTIDRITHDHPNGWLRGGETLTVRMRGTPGSDASFRIPGVAENVKMREVSPGEYEQNWTVPANGALNLAEAPVLGMLKAPKGDERSTTIVQSGNLIQVDTTAPKIADVNPAPRSEVSRNRPLISATFTDQGGSGVAPDRVGIQVDGRDVTRDAAVTGQFFSYTPPQPLEGRSHHVVVTAYDRAGNMSQENWDFTTPETPAVKGIDEIRTNARGEMKPGQTINFAVKGVPGGRASWSMGKWKNIPLRESSPGLYVGSYRLRDTDDVSNAHIAFNLLAPNGKRYTEASADPLSVLVGPPDAPKVTFPGPNDELANPLIIRGTGTPNSTVRLKLDYTEKVLGILGVQGTATQMEVQVGPDGKWASRPIDLGSLSRSRDAQLTVTATAVNARQQESPPTTLRIR